MFTLVALFMCPVNPELICSHGFENNFSKKMCESVVVELTNDKTNRPYYWDVPADAPAIIDLNNYPKVYITNPTWTCERN